METSVSLADDLLCGASKYNGASLAKRNSGEFEESLIPNGYLYNVKLQNAIEN